MYSISFTASAGSKLPLYEQLYRRFRADIQSGLLRGGEKLPSKRALCAELGLSQSTVETAYGMLCAEGYVTSRPKSGYYVSDFTPYSTELSARAPLPEPEGRPKPAFDLSTASVDTGLFPYSSWAKLNKEVLYSSPELLQRGERQGDGPLREALAEFLREYRGVSCSPGQIVVGAGMEYLTGLLIQLFGRETVFAVEDPGYGSVRSTILGAGGSLRYIPLDGCGMEPEALRASGAEVAYITPSHQFPMGITMPAGRRSQLLGWAAEAEGRFIIEDDYDSEFRYGGRPIPAMQGMDKAGRVVYIGTFSRSIAPSMRLAYMVLPQELLARYRSMPGHSLSTVSRYEQAVMARFISEGLYSRHLRRLCRRYGRRRDALMKALSGIPELSISGSGGGIHFLVTRRGIGEAGLLARAGRRGIELQGLSAYCRGPCPLPSTLVMGYGGLEDEKIEKAAGLLVEAWR